MHTHTTEFDGEGAIASVRLLFASVESSTTMAGAEGERQQRAPHGNGRLSHKRDVSHVVWQQRREAIVRALYICS